MNPVEIYSIKSYFVKNHIDYNTIFGNFLSLVTVYNEKWNICIRKFCAESHFEYCRWLGHKQRLSIILASTLHREACELWWKDDNNSNVCCLLYITNSFICCLSSFYTVFISSKRVVED